MHNNSDADDLKNARGDNDDSSFDLIGAGSLERHSRELRICLSVWLYCTSTVVHVLHSRMFEAKSSTMQCMDVLLLLS